MAADRPLGADRIGVDELRMFEGNARRGDVASIAESLEDTGQYKPLVVNVGSVTGRPLEVLAGNHTLQAAQSLGWDQVDVWLVDVDEQTARKINAKDNRLADLGDYDARLLYEQLAGIDDLAGTGYLQADVDALHRDLFPPEPLTDPDDAPAPRPEPVSAPGDIWTLGEHRLLVGSATDLESVRRLCGAVRPDVVWTDPPYGVEYVGKTKDALRIQNDGAAGLGELLLAAFEVVAAVCVPGAPVYVAYADKFHVAVESALTAAGMSVRQTLIWVKNTMVLGGSDYHYKHEPIALAETDPEGDSTQDHEPLLYGFTPGGEGRLGRGGDRWYGDNRATTVFPVKKPTKNADHPTMKPVALIDAMLANSLPPGGVVLDPFSGSGSTLIAAHGRGARALCVELDPRYADVIVRRFEAHTGIVPVRDGEPVSLVKAAA